jgi:hypothetical protein
MIAFNPQGIIRCLHRHRHQCLFLLCRSCPSRAWTSEKFIPCVLQLSPFGESSRISLWLLPLNTRRVIRAFMRVGRVRFTGRLDGVVRNNAASGSTDPDDRRCFERRLSRRITKGAICKSGHGHKAPVVGSGLAAPAMCPAWIVPWWTT